MPFYGQIITYKFDGRYNILLTRPPRISSIFHLDRILCYIHHFEINFTVRNFQPAIILCYERNRSAVRDRRVGDLFGNRTHHRCVPFRSKERTETGTEVVELLVYSSSNAASILSCEGILSEFHRRCAKCVRAKCIIPIDKSARGTSGEVSLCQLMIDARSRNS